MASWSLLMYEVIRIVSRTSKHAKVRLCSGSENCQKVQSTSQHVHFTTNLPAGRFSYPGS